MVSVWGIFKEKRENMDRREEAQELLRKMSACRPRSFFSKMDESQKGIGFVLVCLAKAEDTVLAGDLARELNVSTARIASILKKIEDSGLAVRKRSRSDARHTEVEITPKGLDHVNEMREQLLNKTEMLIEKVGKEDLEEFIRISAKIKDAMEDE